MNATTTIIEDAEPRARSEAARPLAAIIAEHPFLNGMKVWHLEVLASCAMEKRFEAGELIFREGDPANRFYLIQQGKVAVESYVEDQGVIPLQTIGAGDVLGWSWLFPPYYWHFDARAVEPTRAIFFYGTWLREYAEQDHDLGYELMQRMAAVVIQRLQATRRRVAAALRVR